MRRRTFVLPGLIVAVSLAASGATAPAWLQRLSLSGDAAALETGAPARLLDEAAERWAALGFETRTVALNGVELHVALGGEGEGEPLVLLHGYPQSGEIWRDVAPTLARDRRVIVPDLRGMGLSGISVGGHDLANVAEDVHLLVRALGHERVDVVAHDWGGAVGAVYALRHRDEVRRLAFIESAVAGLGFEDVWDFSRPNPAMTFIPLLLTEGLAEDLLEGREETFLRHLWTTFTANKDALPFSEWRPYVDAMERPGLVGSSAGYYRAVHDQAEDVRALVAEGKLDIPVLSVSGAASFGEHQLGFVEAFANDVVEHVTVEGADHFVAEERPERLLEVLAPFLAG